MKYLLIYFLLTFISAFGVRAQDTKMDRNEFWKIIDSSFLVAKGNAKTQEETLVKLLVAYTPEQITEFEIQMRKALFGADHFNVLAAEQIMDGQINDGLYISFRCWLIGQGEKTYTETIKNPEYLAALVDKNTDTEFKGLLYVATEAYQLKTHKKEDDSFPQNVAVAKGLDYEYTEYTPKGVEWKERDLPSMYPKLWAKAHPQ